MVLIRLFAFSLVGLTGVGAFLRLFFYLWLQERFVQLTAGQVGYALAWGLQFDLALAAIHTLLGLLLGALILYGFKQRRWLLAPLALSTATIVALQTSDIMYFHDAARHIGYELSDAASDFTSLFATAVSQYTGIALGGLLFLILALYAIRKGQTWVLQDTSPALGVKKACLAALVMASIVVVSVRGGVFELPLSPLFAYKIGHPKLADLALNGGYSGTYHLFNSSRKVTLLPIPEVETPAAQRERLARLYPSPVPEEDLTFRPMNVVVILLESWPATLIKSHGFDREVTPYFDHLMTRGIGTEGMLAGGHRTTEGIFTTFCSYQNPLGQSLAKSQLTTRPYGSLAQVLSENGWESLFFQGTRKDTSGTGAFAQRLGFQQSYGKEEITEREWGTNQWGVYDQDLYTFSLQTLKATDQPFFAGINTATTHDDSLPPSIRPAFGMDTPQARQMSVLHFADQALEGFIKAYESDAAFGPTLFVLMADHTAGVPGSPMAQYLIPFTLFATDDSVSPLKLDTLVSQRDVAPTVAHLLGGWIPTFTGRSLLQGGPRVADYYHQGLLGWVEGDHVVEINILGAGEVTSYLRTGPLDQRIVVPPDATHTRMVKDALAFTHRSQSLLFAGKSLHFFNLFQGQGEN